MMEAGGMKVRLKSPPDNVLCDPAEDGQTLCI